MFKNLFGGAPNYNAEELREAAIRNEINNAVKANASLRVMLNKGYSVELLDETREGAVARLAKRCAVLTDPAQRSQANAARAKMGFAPL